MKIPHSPRYCKSRFFAEREALANVTTREGTQGAKAPLQSGYFKYGMLNKLLSEGKKMRKFLTALVVVAILATSVLCVACQNFEGSGYDAFKQMKEDGKITFEASESEYGAFLNTVTFDSFTVANDYVGGKYIGVFVNTDDEKVIDLTGMCDSVTYGGATFNYSGVGVDAITYEKGLKVLITLTEDVGNYHYAAVKGEALLFTLPNKVEKVTLD